MKTLYDNNFRGHLPIFISHFLNQRTFQVRIDNTYSDTYILENGIPQGSVLSSTLFILAINNVTKQLPNGVKSNLYVDDFTIFYTATNQRHMQRILNLAIAKVDKWASSVGFQLSAEKTKSVMFYRNARWIKKQSIELKIRNTIIPFNESAKFLGLIFDTHLNWKKHIAYCAVYN